MAARRRAAVRAPRRVVGFSHALRVLAWTQAFEATSCGKQNCKCEKLCGDTSEVNISTVAALLERKRTLLDRMPNSPIRIAKTQHDL
jgi:hypothetical protein